MKKSLLLVAIISSLCVPSIKLVDQGKSNFLGKSTLLPLTEKKPVCNLTSGEQTLYEIKTSDLNESTRQWILNEWQLPNISLDAGKRFIVKITFAGGPKNIPFRWVDGIFEFEDGSSPELTFYSHDYRYPIFSHFKAFLGPTNISKAAPRIVGKGALTYVRDLVNPDIWWSNTTYENITVRTARNAKTGWLLYYRSIAPEWNWEIAFVKAILESSGETEIWELVGQSLFFMMLLIPVAIATGMVVAVIIKRFRH